MNDTDKPPGRTAYEAYLASVGLPLSDWPWEDDDVNQALWDAVAQAVIAEQEPLTVKPSDDVPRELAAETRQLRERVTTIAEGLEQRANVNRPSKVTDICDGIARALRKAIA